MEINEYPPSGVEPDLLTAYLHIVSPPFDWDIKRGEGWVWLTVDLPFVDGDSRTVEVIIERHPNYAGYYVDLRLKSDLLLELGLIDDATPTFGRVVSYLPVVGRKV